MSVAFPDFLVNEKPLTGVRAAQVTSLGGDRLVYAFAIDGEKGGSRLILQTGNTKGDLTAAATQIDAADGESFAGFALSALTDGHYAIAYATHSEAGFNDVTVKIYAADGSEEATAHLDTLESDRVLPGVINLDGGAFLVTFATHPKGEAGTWQFQGQKFASGGKADGSVITLVDSVEASDFLPATTTSGGSVVVAWIDEKSSSVHAQWVNVDGKTAQEEITVNNRDLGAAAAPALTTLKNGDVVIAWTTEDISGKLGTTVHARIYTSAGEGRGEELIVGSPGTGNQLRPSVTALTDGGFVIAWSADDKGDGDGATLYARIYQDEGRAVGEPFVLNATGEGDQVSPHVAMLSDNRAVAIWLSGPADKMDIRATIFEQAAPPAETNHAPQVTSNGGADSAAVSVLEGTTAVTTVAASDTDAGQTLAYSITGGADAALFSINTSTGALTFKTAPVFATPTDAGANNVYDVTVQVSDGHGGTDTQAIAITVGNNNHAPVITSNGAGASASLSLLEGTTAVTTVAASDTDAGQTLAYSITGGADAGWFSINASSGALTFKTAPVFAAPTDAGANNVYDVTVQVSDGHGGMDTQAIAITVGNNNHAPVITSNGAGASATLSLLEGTTAVTTVAASDTDTGQTLAYSITGGADATLFSVNTSTGALTFKVAPTFWTPTDAGANNVYDVTVQVSDGHGGTDTQAIAITVGDTNHAPVITGSRGELTVLALADGATAVTKVGASDADAKQSLTFSLSGLDAALFHIDAATGALAFNTPVSFANPQDAGGNNQYDLRVFVSDGHGGNDSHDYRIVVSEPTAAENVSAVVRVYQAAFGRAPDSEGLSYWAGFLTSGSASLEEIDRQFANSAEFTRVYGATADTEASSALVLAFYFNMLGRAPDAEGLAYWTSLGVRADALLHYFASSLEFSA